MDSFMPVITEIFRIAQIRENCLPFYHSPKDPWALQLPGLLVTSKIMTVMYNLRSWAVRIFMETEKNIPPQEDMAYLST